MKLVLEMEINPQEYDGSLDPDNANHVLQLAEPLLYGELDLPQKVVAKAGGKEKVIETFLPIEDATYEE